ncbi:TIGR01244 family sulfur transferase [Yoonia sp. R2331]|uniref:TIGR01244 family sulfur transferase n=1 Tax=Yoonia sp. R2331 TaxID=3237238 RepID=UPI0034E5EA03
MEIRPITPTYTVSPQIDPADIPAIKAAGYVTIINNRPDAEIPPSHQSAAMRALAEEAGLGFVDNPVTHQGLNMEMVTAQRDVMDAADGPVFAYCASGTRCTIVWALGQAERMSTDDILAAAAEQGYDIGGMRRQLDALR